MEGAGWVLVCLIIGTRTGLAMEGGGGGGGGLFFPPGARGLPGRGQV